VALLHYPVYDKNGRVVVTSITNHDIHDIARVAKTYALGGYYLVTPLLSQQELCRRIIRHWVEGVGSRYNPTRHAAFVTTYLADSLQQVVEQLQQLSGVAPVVIMTSARAYRRGMWATGAELRRGQNKASRPATGSVSACVWDRIWSRE